MKRIEKVTLAFNQGSWRIPELGVNIGQRFEASNVLRGHGLGHNVVRTQEDAKAIGQQIVDAINATGGIELTDIDHEYSFGKCDRNLNKGFDGCSCGRFDHCK